MMVRESSSRETSCLGDKVGWRESGLKRESRLKKKNFKRASRTRSILEREWLQRGLKRKNRLKDRI